jgi:HlyD family secretion protein
MNKKTKLIIGICIAIGLAVILYKVLAPSKSAKIIVETTVASKGDVTTMVTATGTIEAITKVDVGTQVSGVVEKIYVDYNSEVKAGQLIAELDKTNLKAALSQAQAAYDNAVNERDYKKSIFERQKSLYENQVLSKADYDDALYAYTASKSAVIQKLSDLQRAEANLGYANIYSPIDGVILSRDVDEGQTVAASYSTPTLFTIAMNLKEMQVEADVDEADIGQVQEGQRVTFTVDAYQGETFNGSVAQVRLNPTVTSNVVTYTVVITADNPDLKLKPGLTATISIFTLELKDVLTTEAKAVNFKPNINLLTAYAEQHAIRMEKQGPPKVLPPNEETTMLWVLQSDNSIVPRPVSLGASDGVNVQILNGVSEGDRLVYSLKSEINAAGGAMPEGGSPFMPKPPGRR